MGQHISIIYPPEIPSSQLNELLTETRKGNWKGELINKRKDGSLFPILLSTSVIEDDKNDKIAFIGIAIDITEMKKNTDELIAAREKAEESDRLKTAFLANMSHEIRTPMNGILGFTSLLLEPDLSDDTKDEFIRIIHQSGERMLNTVTDIVEISKIEAGIVDVKKTEINVTHVLMSILDFFQAQAEKKGLTLNFDNVMPEAELNVITDKGKFESIITNLVKNAIKYTDNGTISVSYRIKEDFIEFCIKDTGIGIPRNRIKAIFNRFEQADIADNRAFEGSGLGLAIAKSYAEMLGGHIMVESVEGEGSEFCFSVPFISAMTKTESFTNNETATGNHKLLRHLKLLIVEDDEVSAYFLSLLLNDHVEDIVIADSGEQAVELCKSNPDFDVILMDIKMPGIDGFETTRRIRKFNKEVVIIAQTAYALSGDKERTILSGCNDYITKPIQKEELLLKIEKQIKKGF